MLRPFGVTVLAMAFAAGRFADGAPLDHSEWRYFTPIVKSEVKPLQPAEVGTLLARFCESPIHDVRGVGAECTIRELSRAFSDIVDRRFHPKKVIFGHFLSPESNDAVVGGWSAESHPFRWGGTLLLSRRGHAWVPLWYRSALIVDSCEKVVLPDRREILLCEDEDSGMGYKFHFLYSVDLAHPAKLEQSLLAQAVSVTDVCIEQEQILRRLRWSADRLAFSVEIATPEYDGPSNEPACAKYRKRSPGTRRLTFEVTSQGLKARSPILYK